tara:strand:- start:21785 stop:23071 length:1287 start_codon:yes stop_codon:yes gene_type:complete
MNFLLIGKPNVGKSSIYNILTENKNIIHKDEGTTRDWHRGSVKDLKNIYLYDTPGLILKKNIIKELHFSELFKIIDNFIYVIDYNTKNYENEIEFINYLRTLEKKIILIFNKDDNFKKEINTKNFGINNIFFISCEHKHGLDQLYEYFNKYYKEIKNDPTTFFSIGVFGKPNAGKSTLVNSLLGYQRIKTSPYAGTTSDIVEDTYIYRNKNFKILDTAGIFKKNKIINNSLNFKAIRKSLDIIKYIDLSILLIDSNDGFDSQIKKILNMLINQSSSVIIVFNKIDTIINKKNFIAQTKLLIKETYSQTKNLSIIFISAIEKPFVNKLKYTLFSKSNKIIKKIPTSKLNLCLKKTTEEKPHPLINGKSVKFKYAVEVSTSPLVIKIFSNFSKEINKNYKIYLANKFIKAFKIRDTKVNLVITSSRNPFN